jgi:hypothetical protein
VNGNKITGESLAKLGKTVTPTKVGVQKSIKTWIPSFDGMTNGYFAKGSADL